MDKEKEHLTKGPGGFETDNKLVEGALAVSLIAIAGGVAYGVSKVSDGLKKLFSNSKVEVDNVEINFSKTSTSSRGSANKKS